MINIVVVDGYTLNPGDLSWQAMAELGSLTVYERTSPDLVVQRCLEADVVLTNKVIFDHGVFARLPRLRYLGVLATGYNVVDLQAARDSDVVVTNIPAYGTDSVAQFVFAQLLSWMQPAADISRSTVTEWPQSQDFCYHPLAMTELAGKTMGVIGYGAIGQKVAMLARCFGMRVKVVSRSRRELLSDGVTYTTLDDLLVTSDVVSLHCPLSNDNEGLVDAKFLQAMKSSALLINTARGGLVNELDLLEALNKGVIAGALLDVLSVEPPPQDHPLLGVANCRVTPHIAWATSEARQRLLDIAIANLGAFLNGEPVNRIDLDE